MPGSDDASGAVTLDRMPASPLRPRARRNTRPRDLAAWILAPLILVVVIPSNEKIAANQVFFSAHGVSPIVWLIVLVAFLALVWLVLFGLFALLRPRISARAYDVVASVLMLLATWFLLGNLISRAVFPSVPILGPILGLVAALVLTEISRRFAAGMVLMIFAAVAAALPLFMTLINGAPSTANQLAFDNATRRPNVLWVISDELQSPLVVDAQGQVRPEFPNLRSLQKTATTYTHAYAAANYTDYAVPAQLNGIADISQVPRDQMDKIRSGVGILPGMSSQYSVVAESPIYHFECNSDACASVGSGDDVSVLSRFWGFAKDTAAVAGRVSLASPFADFFPSLDGKWRDFWAQGDEFGDNAEGHTVGKAIAGIQAAKDAAPNVPFFALWHTIRTHAPWAVDRQGKLIYPAKLPVVEGAHMVGSDQPGQYSTDDLISMEQRLWANAAVDMDRQLGELMAYLKKNDMWNDTMIVFTADHGAAQTKTLDRRIGDTLQQRWTEVAHVPLIVKYPGQTTPTVVTSPRSTGQIAATVLKAAGATPKEGLTLAPDLSKDLDHGPVFSTVAGVVTPYAYAGAPEPDPWKAEDLSPPDPAHPFALTKDLAAMNKAVPAGYEQIPDTTSRILSGDSDQQLVVMTKPAAACPSGSGLVTDGSMVVGSVLFEQGESAQGIHSRGWAIVPKAEDYQFWCTP